MVGKLKKKMKNTFQKKILVKNEIFISCLFKFRIFITSNIFTNDNYH